MWNSPITASLMPGRRIAIETGGGRPSMRVVAGTGLVLVVRRRSGGRAFAYDTALIEEVLVELPEAPRASDDWERLSWSAVGLRRGNIGVFFEAHAASGEIRARRARGIVDRLIGRRRLDVAMRLRFHEPVVDVAGVGEVAIDWRFTVGLPG